MVLPSVFLPYLTTRQTFAFPLINPPDGAAFATNPAFWKKETTPLVGTPYVAILPHRSPQIPKVTKVSVAHMKPQSTVRKLPSLNAHNRNFNFGDVFNQEVAFLEIENTRLVIQNFCDIEVPDSHLIIPNRPENYVLNEDILETVHQAVLNGAALAAQNPNLLNNWYASAIEAFESTLTNQYFNGRAINPGDYVEDFRSFRAWGHHELLQLMVNDALQNRNLIEPVRKNLYQMRKEFAERSDHYLQAQDATVDIPQLALQNNLSHLFYEDCRTMTAGAIQHLAAAAADEVEYRIGPQNVSQAEIVDVDDDQYNAPGIYCLFRWYENGWVDGVVGEAESFKTRFNFYRREENPLVVNTSMVVLERVLQGTPTYVRRYLEMRHANDAMQNLNGRIPKEFNFSGINGLNCSFNRDCIFFRNAREARRLDCIALPAFRLASEQKSARALDLFTAHDKLTVQLQSMLDRRPGIVEEVTSEYFRNLHE